MARSFYPKLSSWHTAQYQRVPVLVVVLGCIMYGVAGPPYSSIRDKHNKHIYMRVLLLPCMYVHG
jgi:hypothetical protein